MKVQNKTLFEATHNIQVSYRLAFNPEPDIGIRGMFNDNMCDDSLVIDHDVWLIAGDILNRQTGKRYTSVASVSAADPADLVVQLRAQSLLQEGLSQVSLGQRDVVSIHHVNDEAGYLVIQ